MTLPSGRPGPWRATIVGGLVLLGAVVSGCATDVPAASRSSPNGVAPASVRPSAAPSAGAASGRSASPTTTTEAIPSEIGDAPPAATLTAEGGDPVTGQLGSYTWAGAGSDSAWLHGAPLAIGHGEPLAMASHPAIDISSWRARYVPVTADDPTGAASLGEGVGGPVIAAPGAGRWTLEVAVTFADDAGSASYFWELDVDD